MAYSLDYTRAWATNNGDCLFVDSWSGDDLLGNGSRTKPYKSLSKAASASGSYILCRGYFSEQVSSTKSFGADRFGEAVFDGKGIYSIAQGVVWLEYNAYSIYRGGPIYINSKASLGLNASVFSPFSSVLINALVGNIAAATVCNSRYSVLRNVKMENGKHIPTSGNSSYSLFMDLTDPSRCTGLNVVMTKSIYDNCRIYLDVNGVLNANSKMDTCLFRASCTFYVRAADGLSDIRVDADGQTAAQKYAAIQAWFASGVLAAGYTKLPWVNCQITDNKIVNAPDGATDGYDFDFSLIYGIKAAQPACWMDGGKHIGPFPPAVKIEFKETANLTSSPYEVEVKPTDRLTLANGRVSLNADFAGAVLLSKPMPIPQPSYTNFNGVNVPFVADSGTKGLFLIPTDLMNLEEATKIEITVAGAVLELNKVYVVKCADGAYVSYRGNVYTQGCCITGYDATSTATLGGAGAAYIYPIRRPVVFSTVQLKLWENGVLPADFATNDAAYPYITAPAINIPGDNTMDVGLRCLRVGNTQSGAVDVGTDGRPLTNAHPEYYNSTNFARAKFPIRASWVMLKITINSLFNQ